MTGTPIAENSPIVPFKGIRGSIARNMVAGWQVPRVALGIEVDMTRCVQLQSSLRRSTESTVRISVTPIVLRAVALTLREHPYMNALVRDIGIERVRSVNIGLAVSLDDGLAVPVIRDVDSKSITEIADELNRAAIGARARTLPLKAYQSGTFTVTNLGATGVDWFTPILNPPQVGILGLSRVGQKPVVRDGMISVAPMTMLTLVFDHRAVDGQPAAAFLSRLKKRLESCENLSE